MQQEILKNQSQPQIKVGFDTVNQWGSDPVIQLVLDEIFLLKLELLKKKYKSLAVSFCILCEIWFCMQACKGKSFSCHDSIHICPRCNSILAKYEACKMFSLNF